MDGSLDSFLPQGFKNRVGLLLKKHLIGHKDLTGKQQNHFN
jgi:hypothetical protein